MFQSIALVILLSRGLHAMAESRYDECTATRTFFRKHRDYVIVHGRDHKTIGLINPFGALGT